MQKLYIALKDELLARIEDGTYPVGSIIPAETELAESYGVSRPTIRQALQLLVDAGYLDRRRRRGTIVCDPSVAEVPTIEASEPTSAELHVHHADVQSMREQGMRVRTVTIRAQRQVAGEEVADILGIAPDEEVYKLVRVRYMDDEPNIFMVTHVLAEPYPGLLETDFSKTRLYDRMAQVGRPVTSARRRLEMVPADQTMADILEVPMGESLFLFRVLGSDSEGHVVEYSRTTYLGKDNSFEFLTKHEPTV